MGPFIARAVLWLVFGFFLTDIINEFKWFKMPVRWYAVMGPLLILFGLQEAFLKRLEIKRKSLTDEINTAHFDPPSLHFHSEHS